MAIFTGVLLLCFFCAFPSVAEAQDRSPFNLKEYRWENRLLVVFAEHEKTPAYQALTQEIEELSEEFEDRDMVLISLFEQGESTDGNKSIAAEDAARLRQQFDVNTGAYQVFLIGKDGGIKRQGGPEIRLQSLFALIDTMPMRRNEMRRNQ